MMVHRNLDKPWVRISNIIGIVTLSLWPLSYMYLTNSVAQLAEKLMTETNNSILCMVCNTNNDDSCVGYRNPNGKSALGTLSIERVFHRYEAACVQSNDAYA